MAKAAEGAVSSGRTAAGSMSRLKLGHPARYRHSSSFARDMDHPGPVSTNGVCVSFTSDPEVNEMGRRFREDSQFSIHCEEESNEKLTELYQGLGRWDFDIFECARATNGFPLTMVGTEIVAQNCNLDELMLSRKMVSRFLWDVELNYKRCNYFHHSLHAADVMQAVHYLIRSLEPGHRAALGEVGTFALLMAAAVHDVGHPMMANAFHTKNSTYCVRLIDHQDRSVLETIHLKIAMSLMESVDLLATWDDSWKALFRTVVNESVLATDLRVHNDIITRIKDAGGAVSPVQSSRAQRRLDVIQMVMKAADIMNPARPFPLALVWTKMVCDEFSYQGKVENETGQPYSFNTNKDDVDIPNFQLGFLNGLVAPLLELFHDKFGRIPEIMNAVEANRVQWGKLMGFSSPGMPIEDIIVHEPGMNIHYDRCLETVKMYWEPLVSPVMYRISFKNRVGQYEITHKMAESSRSITLLAVGKMNLHYALKLYPEKSRQMVIESARIHAAVQGSFVSELTEIREAADFIMMVTRYNPAHVQLHEYVRRRHVLSLPEILEISTALARALKHFHRNGAVHLDIQPANLLWDPVEGRVILIDLDRGQMLKDGFRTSVDTPFFEMSAYTAPECSGRLDTMADQRADLYGAGAVMWFLMTSSPCFMGESVMDIRHQILTRTPEDPCISRLDSSESNGHVLCDIILKLLSKNPAHRYSSAIGLLTDLKRCKLSLLSTGTICSLVPGVDDQKVLLQPVNKVYGRSSETSKIAHVLKRARQHREPHLVYVKGEGGMGKYAFVMDAVMAVVSPRALIGTGGSIRHNLFANEGILDAVSDIVTRASCLSFEDSSAIANDIITSLGPQVAYLLGWIPNLKHVVEIGDGGEALLRVVEANELLNNAGPSENPGKADLVLDALVKLVKILVMHSSTCVIILRDIEDTDTLSLQAIGKILKLTEPVVVIITKDADAPDVDTVTDVITSTATTTGANWTQVKLGHIRPDDICLQLHDISGMRRGRGSSDDRKLAELASVIHQKTSGYPMFVLPYVRGLIGDGVIRAGGEGHWDWDIAEVSSQDSCTDAIDLVIKDLGCIGAVSREIMTLVCVLEDWVSVEMLMGLTKAESIDAEMAVHKCIENGVLKGNKNFEVQAAHIKIIEWFQDQTPPEIRREVLWRAGLRRFAEIKETSVADDEFCTLAKWMNDAMCAEFKEGAAWESARQQVMEANLRAGRCSMRAGRTAAALANYQILLDLIDPKAWDVIAPTRCYYDQYTFVKGISMTVIRLLGELNNYEGMAALFESVQPRVTDMEDLAVLWALFVGVTVTLGRASEASAAARNAFATLGSELPLRRKGCLGRLIDRVAGLVIPGVVGGGGVDSWAKRLETMQQLGQCPLGTGELTTSLYESALFAELLVLNTAAVEAMSDWAVSHALSEGYSEGTPVGIAFHALVLGCLRSRPAEAAEAAEVAMELSQCLHGSPPHHVRDQALFITHLYVLPMSQPALETAQRYSELLAEVKSHRWSEYALWGACLCGMTMLINGPSAQFVHDRFGLLIAASKRFDSSAVRMASLFRAVTHVLGTADGFTLENCRLELPGVDGGLVAEFYASHGNHLFAFVHLHFKGVLTYLFGEYGEAADAFGQVHELLSRHGAEDGDLLVPPMLLADYSFFMSLALVMTRLSGRPLPPWAPAALQAAQKHLARLAGANAGIFGYMETAVRAAAQIIRAPPAAGPAQHHSDLIKAAVDKAEDSKCLLKLAVLVELSARHDAAVLRWAEDAGGAWRRLGHSEVDARAALALKLYGEWGLRGRGGPTRSGARLPRSGSILFDDLVIDMPGKELQPPPVVREESIPVPIPASLPTSLPNASPGACATDPLESEATASVRSADVDVVLNSMDSGLADYHRLGLPMSRRSRTSQDSDTRILEMLGDRTFPGDASPVDENGVNEIVLMKALARLTATLDGARLQREVTLALSEALGCDKVVLVLTRGNDASDLRGLYIGSVFANGSCAEADIPFIARGEIDEAMDILPKPLVKHSLDAQSNEIVADAQDPDGGRLTSDTYFTKRADVRSVMCVPVVRADGISGAIYAECLNTVNVFNEVHARVAGLLLQQTLTSLSNIHLCDRLKDQASSIERFVPREALDLLACKSVDEAERGRAEKIQLPLLMCDLKGFTMVAEMLTPRQIFQFINIYLDVMEPIVRRRGGFIDKYIGDAILAIFHSTDEALRAAVEMQQALAQVETQANEELPRSVPPVEMGIGLHYGRGVIGTVGSKDRLETTVMGDVVNTCSRLETSTRMYGSRVLLSDAFYSQLRDPGRFCLRAIDSVVFKGKKQVIKLYEALDADPEALKRFKLETASKFQVARGLYTRGSFNDAYEAFGDILFGSCVRSSRPGTPATSHGRCSSGRIETPSDLSGGPVLRDHAVRRMVEEEDGVPSARRMSTPEMLVDNIARMYQRRCEKLATAFSVKHSEMWDGVWRLESK